MYTTIIFDLDGLVIDSEIISYQLYQDLLKPYGHSFSIADYTQNYSGKTAIGNMDALIKRFHLPLSIDAGLKFVALHEKEYFRRGVPLKKGVKELLCYLKRNHYNLVLATSSTSEWAMTALKQHQIEDYFDELVFGTDVENGKPHPDIFLKACQKVNAQVHECLVLEDSEAGIEAAFKAGIPVICIPDMKKPSEKFQTMTTAILPSLNEVIAHLKLNRSYHLVAFDMDGTLLNSKKLIAPECVNSIKEAMQQNKIIIFNTGRCLAELEEYFNELDEIQYLNCISGALVYDRKNDEIIYSNYLAPKIVKQLFQIGSQEDTMIQLLTQKSIIQSDKLDQMDNYHMGEYLEMYQRVVEKWDDLQQKYFEEPFPVGKLNIYHTSPIARERTKERIVKAGLTVEMANAEATSLEISAQGVNKGIGLEKLCEHLHIPLASVIVVGDGDNDIMALQVAGLAIAVENANQVKDMCDLIVGDNDHNGCVEVIEKYVLNKM